MTKPKGDGRRERAVKARVPQRARVRVRYKEPPLINRQVTHADYTLPEINAMCSEGWRVLDCLLVRTVEVDATEHIEAAGVSGGDGGSRLLLDYDDDDIPAAVAEPPDV